MLDDRSGDSLRAAFTKINSNFTELYNALGLNDPTLNLGSFEFTGSVMSTTDSTAITIDQATLITSDLTVSGDIIPSGNLISTLGSPTNKFHSIYVGTGSVYLGDAKLSLENGKLSSSVGFDLTGSVGTVNGTVDWADVTGKPIIPSNTNELTNGAGFITVTNQLVNSPYDVTLDVNGNTTFPNAGSIRQNNSWTRTVAPVVSVGAGSVVWTSTVDYISSAKLVIQVEGNEVGDVSGWHSQACEAIIACRGYANTYGGPGGDPQMIVYGVVHTSVDPLVTFTVQRNPITKMVEVVGTLTAAANGSAALRIHSVEMATRD